MSPEQQQLEAGIQALEAQRTLLGDAVVDMAVAPLKATLAGLAALPAPPAEPAQNLKQVSILFSVTRLGVYTQPRLPPAAQFRRRNDGDLRNLTLTFTVSAVRSTFQPVSHAIDC